MAHSALHHIQQLYQQGYTALEGHFNASECQDMRDILDGYWRSQGSPSLEPEFGYTIHPLLARTPALAPYLDQQLLVEVLGGTLRDRAHLVHLGARISGPQSGDRISWHHHYGWGPEEFPKRTRIERLLVGVYVDGTQPETGAFVALPRTFEEPFQAPIDGGLQAWPGEVHVALPPGSIAIFDTALWHAARRGTGTENRRLWGCHIQGWADTRPHPEDNEVDAALIQQYLPLHPHLLSLVQP